MFFMFQSYMQENNSTLLFKATISKKITYLSTTSLLPHFIPLLAQQRQKHN